MPQVTASRVKTAKTKTKDKTRVVIYQEDNDHDDDDDHDDQRHHANQEKLLLYSILLHFETDDEQNTMQCNLIILL